MTSEKQLDTKQNHKRLTIPHGVCTIVMEMVQILQRCFKRRHLKNPQYNSIGKALNAKDSGDPAPPTSKPIICF